jgi:hypothetical protein
MPKIDSLTYDTSKPPELEIPSICIYANQHCETDVIEGLVYDCEHYGYGTKKTFPLKFGVVDLAVWNDQQIILFEVKYQEKLTTVQDIAHGLGQLLSYRKQLGPQKRAVKCVLYATGEMDEKAYQFLKDLCSDFGVILHARLVEQVKYF